MLLALLHVHFIIPKMTNEDFIQVKRDKNQEEKIELLLECLNKNLIIQNTVFTNCNGTRSNTHQFFIKLNLVFKQLSENGYILDDNMKIEIALCKGSDYILKTYMESKVETFKEFEKMFEQGVNMLADEVFNENEWVRVYDSEDFLGNGNKNEIGVVAKVYGDGFYELLCKEKIVKIHGSKLSKL